MITVKATREGLLNQKTSVGYHIDTVVPFVALPSDAALRLWVRLWNPVARVGCRALVLDVGPWNTHDNAYVFQPLTTSRIGIPVDPITLPDGSIRPQAESGTDLFGRRTNEAGIDLSEAVWRALDMAENTMVSWEFE